MLRVIPILLLFALLAGCGQPTTGSHAELVTVSLNLAGLGPSQSSDIGPAAVPTGVASAKVDIYRGEGSERYLDKTVPIDLASATTEVMLLAGVTYAFELSLSAADATEVAFERIDATVTPELVITF